MNVSLKRAATLVGVYIMVLVAAVATGMVYTGQTDISTWPAEMRTTVATAPLPIVVMMFFWGII